MNLIAGGDDDLLSLDVPGTEDPGAARLIPALSLEEPDEPEPPAEELLEQPPVEEEEGEDDDRSPTAVYKMIRAERRVDVLKEKIAQADNTDEVDRLLVEPFLDHCALSVLFWMRDRFAIGSCGYGTPSAVQQPQKLVVTLESASMMRYAMQTRGIIRGVGENDDIQIKIADQLGSRIPGEVCVTPIILKDHVVKLLTIHSFPKTNFPDDAPQQVMTLARCAGEAYARISD